MTAEYRMATEFSGHGRVVNRVLRVRHLFVPPFVEERFEGTLESADGSAMREAWSYATGERRPFTSVSDACAWLTEQTEAHFAAGGL